MEERFGDVARVMQTYFDGLYHSDTGRLEKVFHPLATYVTATEAKDGRLLHLAMGEYFPIVAARPSPASLRTSLPYVGSIGPRRLCSKGLNSCSDWCCTPLCRCHVRGACG